MTKEKLIVLGVGSLQSIEAKTSYISKMLEQEAIAFAEWLRKCYTPIEGSELWMQSCTHPDFVGQKKPRVPDMTHYTLNELYQIFKQNNP